MFVPAQPRDLPYLRALIREGAAERSFEGELAGHSAESELFFKRLEEALATKVWIRPNEAGESERTATLAWLYHPNAIRTAIGFVAIRAIGALGYELWLTAIDRDQRGLGLGKKMINEFLATPEGQLTNVAQCRLDSAGACACAHILGKAGFTAARVGNVALWMARSSLAPHALNWMRTAPFVSR